MSLHSQFEREREALERMLEEGRIDNSEFNESMRDLERDYRYMAEDAAREAYESEMDRWY